MRNTASATMVMCVVLIGSLLVFTGGGDAVEPADYITYTIMPEGIVIQSANATVLISSEIPAASIRPGHLTDSLGDGFVLRALVGYNSTGAGGFSPDMIEFSASTDRSSWGMSGPWVTKDSRGMLVRVEMNARLDMVRVGSQGMPGYGGPNLVVQNWGEITVRYSLSTYDHESTYQGLTQSPSYRINGSSELKFDVDLLVLKPLPVDSLALELALMKMSGWQYSPPTGSAPYRFRGYQWGGTVTESDPAVNETQGSTPVVHRFEYREQYKQAFDFLNETGVPEGYFSWARQASIGSSSGAEVADVSTYYRTDGEALVLYLSTPLMRNTLTVSHDPSIGIFVTNIHPIVLPGDVGLETHLVSVLAGVAVGAVVAGGTWALVASSRAARQEDHSDLVDLERNRYYRGRR